MTASRPPSRSRSAEQAREAKRQARAELLEGVEQARRSGALVSMEQAAAYLGVSHGTLKNMKSGPTSTRIGSRRLYRLDDLDAYIATLPRG